MTDISLTYAQSQIYQCTERFRVVVAGRRFGKSYEAAVELFTQACRKSGALCYYITQTYKAAKSIMWSAIKKLIDSTYVSKINESELSILLKNGSIIRLVGADNPDALRGVSLSFCVIDEFAYCKEDLWHEVVRPALSDQRGGALFITTPCGMNWAYDMYNYASSSKGWKAFSYTTLDGGQVDKEEVDLARSQLSEKQFAQEYLASFEQIGNRVYYAFDRKVHHKRIDMHTNDIHVGMDFNVNPMCAVVCIKAADELYVIDEIMLENSNTTEMCESIKRKYADKNITVHPDPSGRARHTSSEDGTTDFTIIKSFGFRIDAPRKAPAVIDRVENTNRVFMNANKETKLYVDPKCSYLTKCCEGLTYKKGGERIQDKTLGLDHATDALGYAVWNLLPLQQQRIDLNVQMF